MNLFGATFFEALTFWYFIANAPTFIKIFYFEVSNSIIKISKVSAQLMVLVSLCTKVCATVLYGVLYIVFVN